MSIVARGGVVYGFYMEQSSIDFGYIFPLSPNISLRALALNSVHATAKKIIPGFLVILLITGNIGVGGGGWVGRRQK
jgi:hypothetical protein